MLLAMAISSTNLNLLLCAVPTQAPLEATQNCTAGDGMQRARQSTGLHEYQTILHQVSA